MKETNLQNFKFPIYTIRFHHLNLIYSNLDSNPTSEYSAVFGIRIHFSWFQLPDAISTVHLGRLSQRRQSFAFQTYLFQTNAFCAVRDFLRVFEFGNSFAWRISIPLRFQIACSSNGRKLLLFPLLHVHVLAVTAYWPRNTYILVTTSVPIPVRPAGTTDMILDNVQIAVLSSVSLTGFHQIPWSLKRWSLRHDAFEDFRLSPLFVL